MPQKSKVIKNNSLPKATKRSNALKSFQPENSLMLLQEQKLTVLTQFNQEKPETRAVFTHAEESTTYPL